MHNPVYFSKILLISLYAFEKLSLLIFKDFIKLIILYIKLSVGFAIQNNGEKLPFEKKWYMHRLIGAYNITYYLINIQCKMQITSEGKSIPSVSLFNSFIDLVVSSTACLATKSLFLIFSESSFKDAMDDSSFAIGVSMSRFCSYSSLNIIKFF